MNVDAFDFELPDEAIALRPAHPRDSSRLLHVAKDGVLSDHRVRDLPQFLRPGDVLVINDTKVIRAALSGVRPARTVGGGGDVKVTVNLHKQVSENCWRAFVRPAKRLREGDSVVFEGQFSASVLSKADGGDVTLQFNHAGDELNAEIERTGQPPLPPYIARKRGPDKADIQDYQTIYANGAGSVAAPTAGLHFTDELFSALQERGVEILRVTLHVGAGTFLPVKSGDTKDHLMHSEWYSIDEKTARAINEAKSEGRRVVAVGTTSLRALESAGRSGVIMPESRETDIFITPGYKFKVIDGLMTNFHLPRSTLFMLVSALAGLDTMKAAYQYAIKTGYRFYSYGDASLIWKDA